MKLDQIPTKELRQLLAATERHAGFGSVEVAILRRELAKRERRKRAALRRGKERTDD